MSANITTYIVHKYSDTRRKIKYTLEESIQLFSDFSSKRLIKLV